MTVIIIACIALALLIGILLSRSITVPLERGMHMMQELKKGHLKERLSMNRKDEIGMLAETMDVYAEELSSNVVRIMDRIADGDVSMNIVPQDDKDEVSPAMKKIVNTL